MCKISTTFYSISASFTSSDCCRFVDARSCDLRGLVGEIGRGICDGGRLCCFFFSVTIYGVGKSG